MDTVSDIVSRRLVWRCRRGMKELDVLLERFVTSHYSVLSQADRALFTRALELPDPVLADYLLNGRVPQEPELARLTALIAPRGS